MGQRAAAGTGSQGRALARTARLCLGRPLALVLLLASLAVSQPCRADDPVRGEATFTSGGGFARLVLKLAEDVESDVSTAGSIIIIHFKRPVDIPVDKLSDAVPDYVGSARRDPDGTAIRLSLARRATVNTMTAGERIFVDFLPDSWTGPPPALPAAVVRELAERARAAERALRAQMAVNAAKKRPPVRVRASVQPTFVRFVFEMPDGVNVSSVLNEQKLTLQFNSVLNFDLADAKVAAPPNIASINQRADIDSSAVDIALIGEVDVHSFREEKNYVIDVAFQQADKPALPEPQAAVKPAVPAKPGPAARVSRDKALKESSLPQQPAEIPPATSETIAEQAKNRDQARPGDGSAGRGRGRNACRRKSDAGQGQRGPCDREDGSRTGKPSAAGGSRESGAACRTGPGRRCGSAEGRNAQAGSLLRSRRRRQRRRHPVRRRKATPGTRPPPSRRGVTATACA